MQHFCTKKPEVPLFSPPPQYYFVIPMQYMNLLKIFSLEIQLQPLKSKRQSAKYLGSQNEEGKKKQATERIFILIHLLEHTCPLALIPFKAVMCLRTDFHHSIWTLLLWSLVQVLITTDFQIIWKSKLWVYEQVNALEYLLTTTPVSDKSSCRCGDILTNYKRIGDLLMGKKRTISANLKCIVKYIVVGVF